MYAGLYHPVNIEQFEYFTIVRSLRNFVQRSLNMYQLIGVKKSILKKMRLRHFFAWPGSYEVLPDQTSLYALDFWKKSCAREVLT